MASSIVIVLALAFSCVNAAAPTIGTELNCTVFLATLTPDADFVYTPGATNCVNSYSDSTCATLYAITDTEPAPVPGVNTLRPLKCFTAGTDGTGAVDPDLVRAAVSTCPKTCGLCCQSADYKCPNVQFPRLNCATILPSQCRDQQWRVIIAQDCPSACGFCNQGGCVDAVIECSNDISICNAVGMQDFVNLNCQKTCGRCSTSTTAAGSVATASSGTCTTYNADSNRSCAAWAANGFCQNTFYSIAQRRSSCATTCRIC
ncbi:ShKT domain-containing protein [Caenorhabditis elegans]|uniref:ShKT domain-containing protein n=1 Tax=Caenorhabditis elegans TaxID=6239 RepID=O46001_CAEEL|nr:ShKT domain-containing protein [Caenorhabditis elegans]CAB04987.1 ShKT domain-containing protein [Caenorhabditis elegans]|eukprot:NP_507335.1 Uncharacterized protein CELE_ZK218.7 [Caenorhabditis elegans]